MVCGGVFEFFKFKWILFDSCLNKDAVAQLIERLAEVLTDPGLIPSRGEFFSLEFLLKEEINKW